jgi:iron(III) transport system substrate-binding protein
VTLHRQTQQCTDCIQAIAAGEIDFAITNHYYLLRFKAADPRYPVEQTFFDSGDPGNLVNVAGAGVLATSERPEEAHRFLAFLLSEEAQQFFSDEVGEFPVVNGVSGNPVLVGLDELVDLSPETDLDALRDLEGTLRLLREVGLL